MGSGLMDWVQEVVDVFVTQCGARFHWGKAGWPEHFPCFNVRCPATKRGPLITLQHIRAASLQHVQYLCCACKLGSCSGVEPPCLATDGAMPETQLLVPASALHFRQAH